MTPQRLDYELTSRAQAMEVHNELVHEALQNSLGSPDTMSPEDMKTAIVSLWRLTQFHEHLIDALYDHLTEAKKPWYRRIFKK